ncbi:MAG: transcription-repair coupling factor [Chloroflexi bacterium]|nr:transcription-repair coupling factor [Chloroflexota bacterium]
MNLSGVLPLIENIPEFKQLVAALHGQTTVTADVIESARGPMLAALSRALQAPIVVMTARSDRAKQLADELGLWIAGDSIPYAFPDPDPLFYERMPWNAETIAARLGALTALGQSRGVRSGASAPIVVASTRALMQRTVPANDLIARMHVLRRGAEGIALVDLLEGLVALGYEPAPIVDAPGAFSRRGGILDVWPPANARPVRIEFVGDEIESLREFDPATQRSAAEVVKLMVGPASEALPGRGPAVVQAIAPWDLTACHPVAAAMFRQDRDALEAGRRFRGIEFYLPYFYPQPASLINHLPENGWLVVENWSEIQATAQTLEFQAEEVRGDLQARRELPPGVAAPYLSWDGLREQLQTRHRLLLDYAAPGDATRLPFMPGPRYGGQLRKVIDDLVKERENQSRIVVATRQAERLSDLLRQRDLFVKPIKQMTQEPQPGHIVLVQGAVSEGWKLSVNSEPSTVNSELLNTVHCLLLTDAELFGWSRPKPRRISKAPRTGTTEAFFSDLAIGDFVVHIDHGIGVFRGLVKIALNGPEREFILIEYAHGDSLYVPVHQIDRLSRYVAPGGHAPALHRLGTAEWAQVKERTRKAVEDIAEDLLELYAAREIVSGHAFPPDSTWQHELEAAFPYVETEDQLQAIDQVKNDMESTRPMDRLIVGDVGYGKTEVALRAAFKAASNGKQTALLVPTTVLAQQHYNTFKERLAPFPINVEMLSRFRSDKEQTDIVEKIQSGLIDIVIGTHRLLSDDVKFKDLGLLIVDEEQRFGVVHKERLKQLRQEVDVLTLTATPIPRTLYLSLSGARDMSTIETPPEDRLPIRTYVAEYDERLIRDAILRELDRGGQVFLVHNRVRGIHIVAEQVRKLVPEANIAVGHGQMAEEQLERVMLEFAAGRYDVLVCTTIIESGIDIPNANTLIVNHADKFGLAQLYQLRGRVGRSAARAYAYFLHEKNHPLSAEAHSRLQSLAEASELGAGFQVAMRDLEIRGAGELLGARQHGHITAVGFDLYCRLLANAVENAKSRAKSEKATPSLGFAPVIDLPLQAHIPEDYVPESGLRLRLYRRLADIATPAQVDDIGKELQDRFGPPPEQVSNLLYLLRLKVAAMQAQLAAIAVEEGRIVVKLGRADAALNARLGAQFNGRVKAAKDRAWLAGPGSDQRWQQHLLDVVAAMRVDKPEEPE